MGKHTTCPQCGKSRGSMKHKTECLGHSKAEVRKKNRVIAQRSRSNARAIRVSNWVSRIKVDGAYHAAKQPDPIPAEVQCQ